MANTLQKRELTAEDRQIIAQLIMEGIDGEITEATRSRLKELGNHLEIPAPYGHIVGYLRGYDTDGKNLARLLVDELRGVGIERIDATIEGPSPLGTDWIVMYNILEAILQDNSDYDIRDNAEIEVGGITELFLPDVERLPEWARPLIEHIKTSTTKGDELTLELLAILESTIKARRDKLVEPTV